jgi:hypothetical protein
MRASQIILESTMCRQASANIYPSDPDELFNTCWLKVRERELRDKNWTPKDPKHYFLSVMRNQKKEWLSKRKSPSIDGFYEKYVLNPESTFGIRYERYMLTWINDPTDDEDLQFLKNILTLVLYCSNINDACDTAEMSRAAFWKYRKIAEQRLYDDYHAANIDDFHGAVLV